jgi:hypothetical protein
MGILLKTHGTNWISRWDTSIRGVQPAAGGEAVDYFSSGVPFHTWLVAEGLNGERRRCARSTFGRSAGIVDLEPFDGFWQARGAHWRSTGFRRLRPLARSSPRRRGRGCPRHASLIRVNQSGFLPMAYRTRSGSEQPSTLRGAWFPSRRWRRLASSFKRRMASSALRPVWPISDGSSKNSDEWKCSYRCDLSMQSVSVW